MSTERAITGIPADTLADLEAVAAAVAAGRKPDPELARRVRERARRSTELIRQTRDEE
jgi:hypothetical protein